MNISRATLLAAACACGLSVGADATAQVARATGTAATVLAIGGDRLEALQDNFSTGRWQFSQKEGEKIYQAVCQGCHMPQGQGARAVGFYPPLAKNPKLAAAAYPIAVVMNGLHGMPAFSQRLSDEQVAAVVNYVRTGFGNELKDAVRPEDVRVFRQ